MFKILSMLHVVDAIVAACCSWHRLVELHARFGVRCYSRLKNLKERVSVGVAPGWWRIAEG
jgi:hypothetical protein